MERAIVGVSEEGEIHGHWFICETNHAARVSQRREVVPPCVGGVGRQNPENKNGERDLGGAPCQSHCADLQNSVAIV